MTRLYSISEAADVLSVPFTWLRDKVTAGQVPHTRLGRHVRFPTFISPKSLQPVSGRRPRCQCRRCYRRAGGDAERRDAGLPQPGQVREIRGRSRRRDRREHPFDDGVHFFVGEIEEAAVHIDRGLDRLVP